jgi:hypothetical protein
MNTSERARPRAGLAIAAALFACGSPAVAWAAADVPAALANLMVRDADVSPCFDAARAGSAVAFVAKNFELTNVILRSGPQMVVVQGGDSCVCGNANCKVSIFRKSAGAFVPVLSDYAISVRVRRDGTAVLDSHDSASTSYRTTYRWNGTKYAVTKDEIVLQDPLTVKPARQSVKFSAGASKATLTGRLVQAGYDDEFDFDANAGQTVTLTLTAHDTHFGSFALNGPNDTQLHSASGGRFSYKLPKSGTYHVVVDGLDQSFTAYAIELGIR